MRRNRHNAQIRHLSPRRKQKIRRPSLQEQQIFLRDPSNDAAWRAQGYLAWRAASKREKHAKIAKNGVYMGVKRKIVRVIT